MDAKRKDKYIAVILANLTVKEYARVQAARVPYTGATGTDASPYGKGGPEPYIATSTSEMKAAIRALRWKHFTVAVSSNQWLVSKRTHTPIQRLAIDACKAHGWS